MTADLEEAREWFDVLPEAMGIDGLVVKGASSRYVGGRREWLKVRHRATLEVIVGAVTGSLARPEAVVAGRYRGTVLEIIGRTVQLKDAQAKDLAAVLKPAGPTHPWPDEISSDRWAGKDNKVRLVKVQPKVVIEVAADAALQAGQRRLPLRLIRLRPDLRPEDLPPAPHQGADG